MNERETPEIDIRLVLIGLGIFLTTGIVSLVLIFSSSQPDSKDPIETRTAATPEENARLLERASAELNRQGRAHVLPPSFAELDSSLKLLRDLSAKAEPNEILTAAAELSDEEIRQAAEFLEVREWGDEVILSMQRPWSTNLTPVSALSADEPEKPAEVER